MTNFKLASMLLAATLGLATNVTITLPAHAASNPICTNPNCGGGGNPGGGDPGDPGGGNPGGGNPGDGDGGKPSKTIGTSFVPSGVPLIDCRVAGLPRPVTDDLKFRNFGTVAIPAGTRVYWLVTETQDHGYYTLPNDLAPGQELLYADILSTGTPPADHCRSKIM
jgi:hypothetical protein